MENTSQDIVVGYDGSPAADLALMWAARTASLANLPVTAVMVEDQYAAQGSAPGRELEPEQTAFVSDVLSETGAQGKLERRVGTVVPVLLEAARDASILVVGSHGRGSVAGALLGSVSQHVARHAACPVVVVRASADPAARRIVVGIDGSGGSAAALEFACRRAELTGEDVVAVHAWKTSSVIVDRQGQLPNVIGAMIEDAEILLSESVAGVRAKHPDVTLRQEGIPVAPGQALVDASATASLVVTGSHGRGAFAGMLLGSVSHDLLMRAHCPVVIVR